MTTLLYLLLVGAVLYFGIKFVSKQNKKNDPSSGGTGNGGSGTGDGGGPFKQK